MGKILLLGALGVLVWWLWRKLHAERPADAGAAIERPAEAMVPCAHCGVHQPRSECVASRGLFYCSEAHRQLAEPQGGEG